MILRQTKYVRAEESTRGVRLVAKSGYPRQRVVRRVEDFGNYLAGLDDATFDAACVLDYGIGCWKRGK
jgi:hypothetical protein